MDFHVVKEHHPTRTNRFQYLQLHVKNVSISSLHNYFSILFIELAREKVLHWFIDTHSQWLESIMCVSRHSHSINIVVLQQREDCFCALSFEYIKNGQCWLVSWQLQFLPSSVQVSNQNVPNVWYHGIFI